MITWPSIYIIRNTLDGKMYIGAGNPEDRLSSHARGSRNAYLRNAINKHGWGNFHSFSWNCGTAEAASIQEQWLINFFGGANSRKLYNAMEGGAHCGFQSEESRRRRSASLKGRIFSEEHRANLSASRNGRQPICDEEKRVLATKRSQHQRWAKWRAERSAAGLPWVIHWNPNLTAKETGYVNAD